MRALKAIEDQFGSLHGMSTAMNASGRIIDPLIDVLLIALNDPAISKDYLLDNLDPRHLNEYSEALSEALTQALPAPTEGTAPGEVKAPEAKSSNGAISTTSPPSGLVAATSSSGQ
jgi:hypothetical protein